MSSYKEICETLKFLKEQNEKLKETIKRYQSGEIEEILNKIIDTIQENDLLERKIRDLYVETYDKVTKIHEEDE